MRDPKRLPYGLLASLALNAVLVGALIGVWSATVRSSPDDHGRRGEPPAPMEEILSRGVIESLSPEDRRKARRTFARTWGATRQSRIEMDQARARLSELIVQEPYDAVAVSEAFQQLSEAEQRLRSQMHGAINEVLGGLPVETRKQIADRAASARHRPRGMGPPPPRPDGPPPADRP